MLITYASDPSHLFVCFLKWTCYTQEFETILIKIYKCLWEVITLFPLIQFKGSPLYLWSLRTNLAGGGGARL